MQAEVPLLSIVIPSHGRFQYVLELLDSIVDTFKEHLMETELFVIDDFSKMPYDFKLLSEKYAGLFGQGIEFIRNEQREYASSCRNIGLRKCKGEFIFFLDDDNVVTNKFLTILLEFIERNKEYAAVGGVSRSYWTGELQHYVWKISLNPVSLMKGKIVEPTLSLEEQIRETDFIPNAFLVRKSAALDIGGFDKSFPIYFEDTDFGIRLKSKGKIGILSNAVIRHKGSPSVSDMSPFKGAMNVRGCVFFVRKHAPSMIYFAFFGILIWCSSYFKSWIPKSGFSSIYKFLVFLFRGLQVD